MIREILTAQMSYRGPGRLDITRKSGGPEGIVFAPSWAILGPAIAARRAAEDLRRQAERRQDALFVPNRLAELLAQADDIERRAWVTYEPLYLAEMDESERRHPDAWQRFRARHRVVLVCYCPSTTPLRCHRALLARREAAHGAVWLGEIGARGQVTPAG